MPKSTVILVTPDESAQLQEARRRASRDLRDLGVSTGRFNEMDLRRLGGSLYVTSRDRNQCLLASVCFRHWPDDLSRYVRRLRIVRGGVDGNRTVAYTRRG